MYRSVLLLLLLASFTVTKSQTIATDYVEIKIPGIHFSKKLPVNRIEILDRRYDSTKVGYVQKGSSFKRLVVIPSMSAGLTETVNREPDSSFTLSNNSSLLVVIKNLWLRQKANKSEGRLVSECIAKLEIYLKKDSFYFPVTRIDSVYTQDGLLRDCFASLLGDCFEKSLSKMETLNFESLAGSRKLTLQDIENYNSKRFDKPILTTHLQKGIYMTFEDFVQNRVDAREFEIEFGKITDQLYLSDKNSKTYFTEFWGVCDGETLYINGGFKLFALTRINNGFEFWANTNFIKHKRKSRILIPFTAGTPTSLLSGAANYGINELANPTAPDIVKPYQINMETGQAY